jgi:hypothetical protein
MLRAKLPLLSAVSRYPAASASSHYTELPATGSAGSLRMQVTGW